MFAIDFTKPYLYKDVVYFHQGNLSTNNTLRCTLNTGGSNDLTGCNIICTFKLQNSTEISGAGRIIDPLNAIIDLVFPSNALAVGLNKLEILVNRSDGSVAQSPSITYDIWQGLTTGNGVEVETNYPILIELINSTNEASNKANLALDKVNSMKVELEEVIDFSYRAANNADIAASNANYKIDEVDEKIGDVNRALAAGTVDLELKEARKDASGVVHDTVKQRLDSDLIVGDKSLKDFVIDMNGMKETQDLAYETDKGYKVCQNTQVGVVKDLKLYGKTIRGLLHSDAKSSYTLNSTTKSKMFDLIEPIQANTDIYIRVNVTSKKAPLDGLKVHVLNDDDTVNYFEGFKGVFEQSLKIKHAKSIKKIGFYLSSAEFTNDDTANITFEKPQVTLVDVGTTYIDGLMSVGNDNEIEVLSRKEDGNLINPNTLLINKSFDNKGNESIDNGRVLTDYILVEPSERYYFEGTNYYEGAPKRAYVCQYDVNKKPIMDRYYIDNGLIDTKVNARYVRVFTHFASPNGTTPLSNLNGIVYQLYKGSSLKPNIFKQDKKTILFKDVDNTWKPILNLRGIDGNNCDTIDSVNNRYSVKVKEITNLKDMRWSKEGSFENKDTYFYKLEDGLKIANITQYGVDCVCDKLKSVSVNYITGAMHNIVDCVAYDVRYQVVRISVPKNTNLVEYLTNLNPRFIYPLNEVVEYKISPVYPESYSNETMILFSSGVVVPYASWKITSSLPNFVKELSNQIKQLQDQVYKTNVANFTVALNTLDTKLRLDRLEAL